MSEERKQALWLGFQDKEGHDLGGLIILDQGHRRLHCDWFGTCTKQAVVAIVPRDPRAAPQLACGGHVSNMYLAIWRPVNPPKILVKNGAAILAKNDQVRS